MNRVTVKRRDNDSIQQILKIFKRKVIQSGHIKELYNRKFYNKPSDVRRKELQQALRENKKSKD